MQQLNKFYFVDWVVMMIGFDSGVPKGPKIEKESYFAAQNR